MIKFWISLLLLVEGIRGFMPGMRSFAGPELRQRHMLAMENDFDDDKIAEELRKKAGEVFGSTKKGLNLFTSSLQESGNFKQAIADVIAGDFDRESTRKVIDEKIASGACVMFSWEVSPSCRKAKALLEDIGVDLTVVRLDDPWEEGNKLRSELGRMVGQSSVPAIFVNGEYVGGCDDGPTEQAPGVIPLAFQGKLRAKLIKAGALEKDFMIDL